MIDHGQVWMKYPVAFLTALLVALVLTPVWRRWAPAFGLVDLPNARRIHRDAIPSAGGIVVWVAFHAGCAAIFLLPWKPFAGQITMQWWVRFAVASLSVILLGVLDDRFTLRPLAKLVGQILAGLLAYGLGMRMGCAFGLHLPWVLDAAGTVAWFLVFMNAFNLIDGMDGLATGLALVATLGVGSSLLFRQQPGDVMIMLALAGAGVGFLRYNFHPASVFLGDTGSLFLGYALAALALGTSSKGTTIASIGVPVLAAGIPVLDTGLAVWRRSVRVLFRSDGSDIMANVATGDTEHLHHRLIRLGLPQQRVAVLLYIFGAVLSAVGVVSAVWSESALGVLLIAFLVGAYVVVRYLAWIELWDSGKVVVRGLNRPTWRTQAPLVYPLVDVVVLSVTLAAAMALAAPLGWHNDVKYYWMKGAPYAVGMPFLLLVLSRAYTRVWSLARVSEYALTGCAVATGIGLSLGARLAVSGHEIRYKVVEALLHAGFAIPWIVGTRAFPRVVQDAMSWRARRGAVGMDVRRVLLVGTGTDCMLFLRERSIVDDDPGRLVIVGLVVDDPSLRGRWLHGYRVMGGPSEIPEILARRRVDRIIVVSRLSEACMADALAVARRNGVTVRQRVVSMNTLEAGGQQRNEPG